MRRLDDTTWVIQRQLLVSDVPALSAQGVRLIVNNRPDDEEPGQPSSTEIETAARSAGLDYRHIPIRAGFAPDRIEAMAQALEQGPALLFCRSGTRSTCLWALARRSRGVDPDMLCRQAAGAGYDLRTLLSR